VAVLVPAFLKVYYPYMASIVGKKRGTATYYYLVESARVDGKAPDRLTGVPGHRRGASRRDAAAAGLGLPDRTGHKDFGAVAAAWGMLEDLGVAGIIDEAAGPARPGSRCPRGRTWRWRH